MLCTRSTSVSVVVNRVDCRIPTWELFIRLSVILYVLNRQGYLSWSTDYNVLYNPDPTNNALLECVFGRPRYLMWSTDNTAFCNLGLSNKALFHSMFCRPASSMIHRVHYRQRFSELVSSKI